MRCVEHDGLPEADDARLFWVWGKADYAMFGFYYGESTYPWRDLDGEDMYGVTHYQAIDVPEPGVCPKCGVPDVGKEEA